MPGRPDLGRIAAVPGRPFKGTVLRVVPESLHDKILSTEGNALYAGRYHLKGETGILYTSIGKDLALKEIGRHAARNPLATGLAIGRIRVGLQKALDLTDPNTRDALCITQEDITGPGWGLTQAISRSARNADFQGILAPSATGGGANLVIFENNLAAGCSLEVIAVDSEASGPP